MAPLLARAVVLAAVLLAPAPYDQTFDARVLAVHDGDTLTVQTAASVDRIRLAGIDCPEHGQAWAVDARQFTSSLVLSKTVTVRGRGRDRFDRLLARVFVEGTDVNLAIVKAGLAWQYDEPGRDRAIADAERDARRAARGLWSERLPQPPWQWRREHPRKADPGVPSGPMSPPESPSAKSGTRSRSQSDAHAAGPLHGNVKSRLFHRPGCPNYNCRNCTEQFLTEESAVEAGYEPAGDCRRR